MFKVLDAGNESKASNNGIALILDKKQGDDVLKENGALLVNVEGKCFDTI